MITVKDSSRCCGCTACQSICPHDAVTMKADRLGFLYPEVDADKCVDCGLCESVCAFTSDMARQMEVPDQLSLEVHAARHNDSQVVGGSQSGGVFTALSDIVLDDGGVVYGAAFDDEFNVCHKRALTRSERDAMRGSKYVQSDLSGIFKVIREDLAGGRQVMFTGTPCQVAGLKAYIPVRLQENLFTVDFICHGVPSPSVWRDYVKYMGRKGRVVKTVFRDKVAVDGDTYPEVFSYEDGSVKKCETYRLLFHKNIMLRHSCHACPYDITQRKSDLTMGDFWGVEEVLPSFDGVAGTSMLICSTEKGRAMLERAVGSMTMRCAVLDHDFISEKNPNLIRPTRMYKDRVKFETEYAARGFLHVARKWSDLGVRYRLWRLKVFLRRFVKAER